MKRHLFWMVLVAGCNPYFFHEGEFNAGAADPINYPPPYLGSGGDRMRPGRGRFTEVRAYANGSQIGYFSLQFSTAQAGTTTPLRLIANDVPSTRVPTPTAYNLDGTAPCRPPDNYVYDPRLDDVRLDMQGNIFTVLPTATYPVGATATWSYAPVVAERTVSGTLDCQSVKTETTLLSRADLTVSTPTGRYLAWGIIDVAAGVYRVGEVPGTAPGTLTQRFGWFDHFIVAYLDGGFIPTRTTPANNPDDGRVHVDMVPQRLYIPSRISTGPTTTIPGAVGAGYDVLEAARGGTGYSPVCAVYVYDTSAAPPTMGALPRSADTIVTNYYGGTPPTTPPTSYFFCFQVQ